MDARKRFTFLVFTTVGTRIEGFLRTTCHNDEKFQSTSKMIGYSEEFHGGQG